MSVSTLEFPYVIPLLSSAEHTRALGPVSDTTERTGLEALSDEELIVRSRHREGEAARECLAILYRRHYAKVARWCLRVCDDAEAADAAQEVFLRVHERLDTFRMESRFATWLYTVTRSVAINRSRAATRRRSVSVDPEQQPEPRSPERAIDEVAAGTQIAERLRQTIRDDLDPLEARVLYLLHHVHGLTLRAITGHLHLTNKSGAKAYLVAAQRKLRRRFGRWLESQSSGRART